MKKIIYFLSIMFFASSIKAISPMVDYQANIYSNRIGDKLYSGQMAFIFMDDHIVYCLDPFQIVGENYYQDNTLLNKYDSETIEYFELVSYYGYNLTDRNNIYYYMAAQELIWEKILNGDYIYWTTEKDGKGDLINIDSYKNEIISNIDKYYLKPTFEDKYFSLPFFDTIKIYDYNDVFQDYDKFNYVGNNFVVKNERGFIITILEEGKQEISYSKTIKSDNETKIYSGNGIQTLASFGINKTISGQFSFLGRDYYTNLSLVFYDEKTNEIISDVEFEVSGSVELNKEWKNRKGIFYYSDEVNEGEYKINVLNDYEIVSNSDFEINIKDFQKDTTIKVYLKNNDEIIDDTSEEDILIERQPDDDNLEDEVIVDEEIEIDINVGLNDIESDFQVSVKNEREEKNETVVYEDIVLDKEELIELPNTYNYNLKKYILLFIIFIIGIILNEKEIRN